MTQLADHYRAYIACLNDQRWDDLGTFVASDVTHNGRSFGLDGYRSMLINDFETIPDLSFKIELLACDPPFIAARLEFDCAPKSMFLGLPINGRRISFAENVFYEFRDLQIVSVWSVIDKTAIEAQLGH
ncbi:ester cyclase [Rhizobium rhizogenes]|uniref:Ester cyclase n=1 Tax=Rhizobium rhizogenes TaxID=359 RepID=A0AA92C7J4_RHIRH|nr:ester cyclase [Rhizobium rhizogenes]PVE56927.1 ester cyclase [Rhizobium rhizogenes]PVE68562.1 ester cyclase [Agrobacterium tumefaciens]PVE78310.1 ester cyclase [Sphingomonas sp. TPD3009]